MKSKLRLQNIDLERENECCIGDLSNAEEWNKTPSRLSMFDALFPPGQFDLLKEAVKGPEEL